MSNKGAHPATAVIRLSDEVTDQFNPTLTLDGGHQIEITESISDRILQCLSPLHLKPFDQHLAHPLQRSVPLPR